MDLFLDQTPLATPPFFQFCSCYTLSTSLKTKPNPWVCQGICTCYQGFGPPCLGFSVIKDCLHITSLASFKFGFPQLELLNKFSIEHRCGVFFLDFFLSTFSHMSHLLIGNLLNMVFKHFQDSFDLEYSTNSFIQLHQLSSHVAINYIP